MTEDVRQDFDGLKIMVDHIWGDMAVAQAEIEWAQERYPQRAEMIDHCFKLLLRPKVIASNELYRAHVQELIERVVVGADTRLLTRAEVLALMGEVSLQMKLNKHGMLVLAELGKLLAGMDEVVAGLEAAVGDEEYPGQAATEIRNLQLKYQVEDRVLN